MAVTFTSAQMLNVKIYGAVGDGVTDDTAAIQAAIDGVSDAGGIIYIPTGDYKITSTLNLLRGTGPFSIRFLGSATLASVISYAGPTNGTAILARRVTRFEISNLYIRNLVARGTTVGVKLTSVNPGSDTGPGIIQNVVIDGFDEGLSVGASDGHAASEIEYHTLIVTSNNIGVALRGSNSLDHQFHNFCPGGNGVGLYAFEPDNVYIYGGSATGNTTSDFKLGAGGGYGIYAFRSEGSNRVLQFASTSAASTIIMSGCRLSTPSNADQVMIEGLGGAAYMTLIGNTIFGKVKPNNGGTKSVLIMEGNAIKDTAAFDSSAISANFEYFLRGNCLLNADGTIASIVQDTASQLPVLPTQSANRIYGGPSSGAAAAPTFRALVAADLPSTAAVTNADNGFTAQQTITRSTSGIALTVNANYSGNQGVVVTGGGVGLDNAEGIFWKNNSGSYTKILVLSGNELMVRGAGSGITITTSTASPIASFGEDGTIYIRNYTASTGVTHLIIQDGAGQSTNESLGIYASDGTTPRLSIGGDGKIGFFGHARAAQPSAYSPSNYTTSRSLNGSTATLNDVINYLATLSADLQSLGLVG
jgi:hypothetical protein